MIIEMMCGRADEPPTLAHQWSEAPSTGTGQRRWWVTVPGRPGAHLVKRTHPARLRIVQVPYEFVDE